MSSYLERVGSFCNDFVKGPVHLGSVHFLLCTFSLTQSPGVVIYPPFMALVLSLGSFIIILVDGFCWRF
ncbi:hypothetical protein EYF80_016207 [Liparis tanakae]|uniref:Uncharacterized protein n=1 Tax=Liparis tanakae TaxID=230148 RepID=A0A4Z2I8B4_9TELE|nr:hypothetical protein EYF80_016207 [Liparis tanakae]